MQKRLANMHFIVENINNERLKPALNKINARRFVLLCKKGTNEQLLNQYLLKKYKITLTAICLKLINSAKCMLNFHGETIITFPDKTLDELATLITFGTGKIPGSNILKYAFGQK